MKLGKDRYGEILQVDETVQKLYQFSNKKRELIYTAEIMEGGKKTGFYTIYKEEGVCNDTEEKISTFGNKLILQYAISVDFDKNENDPEQKKWNRFIKYIKENENAFFDEYGDFRKEININLEELKNELLI
jgi:hypothetical protein